MITDFAGPEHADEPLSTRQDHESATASITHGVPVITEPGTWRQSPDLP